MPTFENVLPIVLLPACIAGLVLLIGWRAWRRSTVDGRWSGGLALGLAFFAGYVLLVGAPPLPFAGGRQLAAQEKLAWLALAGGLAFVFEPRTKLAPALRILFGAALLACVLPTRLLKSWERADLEHAQLLLGLLFALVWSSTELLARRSKGAGLPLALLVAGGALALVLGLTGSALLGQLAGALTAAVGAAWVLALLRPSITLAGPGVALGSALFAGLALCGFFYSYTPLADALLAGLAPLGAWCAELPALRGRPRWQRALVGALGVAIPAGVAVTRAVLAFEPDPYASY